MVITQGKVPENKEVKEYLGWRATCVTEAQRKNLVNKLGDAICLKTTFVTYVGMSEKPVKVENGKAVFPQGTKIVHFTLSDKDGREFLPLFTSEEDLLKWTQAAEKKPFRALLRFDDLGPIFINQTRFAGACINPMTDNFVMPRELIASWTTRKNAMKDAALKKAVEEMKKDLDDLTEE